jgi:hypothetical protein
MTFNNTPKMINIFDAKGSKVYSKLYPINSAFERMDVDLRYHGKGIYMVEVADRSGRRLKIGKVLIF